MFHRPFRDYVDGVFEDPIEEGKHRVKSIEGDMMWIQEKHPDCNWTNKNIIIHKSLYKKQYKKENRVD